MNHQFLWRTDTRKNFHLEIYNIQTECQKVSIALEKKEIQKNWQKDALDRTVASESQKFVRNYNPNFKMTSGTLLVNSLFPTFCMTKTRGKIDGESEKALKKTVLADARTIDLWLF